MADWIVEADKTDLVARVSADLAALLRAGIAERGAAGMAVPGGSTPAPVFAALRETALDWPAITLTLGDDRWVAADHPASNAGLARRTLLTGNSAAARFLPLVDTPSDLAQDAAAADARLAALDWPLDVQWLGVGLDGHTASLFPGEGWAAAMDPDCAQRVVALTPDRLPAEAPYPRLTMSLRGLLEARQIIIVANGMEKRAVLDAALPPGPLEQAPIRAVLNQTRTPVRIYWCP